MASQRPPHSPRQPETDSHTIVDDPSVASLRDQLELTVKTLAHVRHRVRQSGTMDPGGYPVLKLLAQGPRRVSALAELLRSDVSTTSRRVTDLTRRGLVAKTRDPEDHRAWTLVLTDDGRALLQRQTCRYHRWLAAVLADWERSDVDRLTTLLGRLQADVERTQST